MSAVILGIPLAECDGFFPRTRDGRCQGCGTTTADEEEHRRVHREAATARDGNNVDGGDARRGSWIGDSLCLPCLHVAPPLSGAEEQARGSYVTGFFFGVVTAREPGYVERYVEGLCPLHRMFWDSLESAFVSSPAPTPKKASS